MAADSDFPAPEHLRNDEVAARTTWAPLRPKDGANYRMRFSNRQSEHRLTFDPTRTSKIVVLCVFVFTTICLVLGIMITYLWLSGAGANMEGDTWVLKYAGLGFLAGEGGFRGIRILPEVKVVAVDRIRLPSRAVLAGFD